MTAERTQLPARDTDLQAAHAALERGEVAALSVDAFDTLLLRRVPKPVDAFVVLGDRLVAAEQLAPDVSLVLFAAARERAEQRARERKQQAGAFPEVTLDEIWAEFPDSMLATTREVLVDAELAVERDLVFADRGMAELVAAARTAGVPVIVTSETYLSGAQLHALLEAAGIEVDEPSVLTSSDRGRGKSSGLYDDVIELLGIEPEQILHVGDYFAADVEVARASGLQALHRPLRTRELEVVLERERRAPAGPRPASSDIDPARGDGGLAALRARLQSTGAPADASSPGHWGVGAGVLGPVFAGFAQWIVDHAATRGLHRLGFLMREGTLLAPLVAAEASARGVPLETEPLWLSRHLCARAAIVDCDYSELRIFVDRRIAPTVAELAGALGLSLADLGELGARATSRLDEATLREDLLGRICGDQGARERVVSSAATLRARLVEMVERTRHEMDDGITIVDLGWHGTTQRMLVRALRAGGSSLRVSGRYLMTTGRIVDAALDGVDAEGFLVDAGVPHETYAAVIRSPEVLEELCMGDEGSVVDLDESGQPILGVNAMPRRQIDEALATRQGIARFASEWRSLSGGEVDLTTDVTRSQLRATLARFVGDPTAPEVQLFGGWVHDDNFGTGIAQTLVHSELFHDGAYLDETRVDEVDALWPRAIVARDTEATPDEHRSMVALYVDDGTGYSETRAVHRVFATNRSGLSYIQLGVSTDGAQRVRLDPMSAPAIVRLDRVALRLGVRGRPDPVVFTFPSGRELGTWDLHDCFWLTDTILVGTSFDPYLVLELDPSIARDVTSVLASVACATMEVPDSALADNGELVARRERAASPRVKASVREVLGAVHDLRTAVSNRLDRGRDASG